MVITKNYFFFSGDKMGKRAKKIDNSPDGVSNNEKVTDGWRRNK